MGYSSGGWANTTGWSSPFSLTPPPGLYALGFVGSARYALSAGNTLEGWVLGEGGPDGFIDSPAGGSYLAPMLAGGASTLDGIWLRNDGGQSGYEVWAALGL